MFALVRVGGCILRWYDRGFLFGVPKVVSNPVNTASQSNRYKVNTNLEEISDWLTKIILGLGLVHVEKVIRFIGSLGEQVATAIGTAQGAKAIAVSAMVYGFVCGFIVVYIWTRTSLTIDFANIDSGDDGVRSRAANAALVLPETQLR